MGILRRNPKSRDGVGLSTGFLSEDPIQVNRLTAKVTRHRTAFVDMVERILVLKERDERDREVLQCGQRRLRGAQAGGF